MGISGVAQTMLHPTPGNWKCSLILGKGLFRCPWVKYLKMRSYWTIQVSARSNDKCHTENRKGHGTLEKPAEPKRAFKGGRLHRFLDIGIGDWEGYISVVSGPQTYKNLLLWPQALAEL